MKNLTLKQLFFVLCGCVLSIPLSIEQSDPLPQVRLDWTLEAHASSGGRSGGGSFRSGSPPSPKSASPTNPSYSDELDTSAPVPRYPRSNVPYDQYRQVYPPQRSVPAPIVIPVPVGPPPYTEPYDGRYTTTQDNNSGLLGLILFGGLGCAFFAFYLKAQSMRRPVGGSAIAFQDPSPSKDELSNNTVTVSKVQVALLAQAQEVPTALTAISSEADTHTREGLHRLLQESVLLLLRNSENWSHASAVSQTVHRLEQAEALFNQLSITERSKFKVETLTHVGGKLYKQAFTPPSEQDPAAYIVVTLLVGSGHDKPLFNGVRTEETLREALQSLASISIESLMVFEVLWSPQSANDHLTYEQMLSEYTSMIPL